MNLSGGEKTLSSLALVFALHQVCVCAGLLLLCCAYDELTRVQYKPTPIYVMDEIDAALDFRNVSIVAHYIKERTKNVAQFVVISLRSDMFELADRLVGIYKTQDNTKSVTIDPNAFHIPGVVNRAAPVAAPAPVAVRAPSAASQSVSRTAAASQSQSAATVLAVSSQSVAVGASQEVLAAATPPSQPAQVARGGASKKKARTAAAPVSDKGKEEDDDYYEDAESNSVGIDSGQCVLQWLGCVWCPPTDDDPRQGCAR